MCAYVREMCKCKRNKATLSWLRLVCCRHEVPVTSEPITVIHMDEDVVVVNKPASIPVSGVLPERYCQKQKKKENEMFVPYCLSPRGTRMHTRISHGHTHTYIHASSSHEPIPFRYLRDENRPLGIPETRIRSVLSYSRSLDSHNPRKLFLCTNRFY